MDMLWDKKDKMNKQMKVVPKMGKTSSLLNRGNDLPGTKREINLLSGRLNKLFPTNNKFK